MLDPKVVQVAADLGAHVRITVYSPLLIIDDMRVQKTPFRRKRVRRRA